MNNSNTIVFISSGMLSSKKKHQRMQLYINYGFLGLASILAESNNVIFFQNEGFSPEEAINRMEKESFLNSNQPIFISIPSYYAVEWAKLFINLLKHINPLLRIIIGGRWVLSDKEWALRTFDQVDVIVNGQAENIILNLLEIKVHDAGPVYIDNSSNREVPPDYTLNYSILYDYPKYTPSIELSRGCGFGCEFCADKAVPLSSMKEPEKIVSEIKSILELYSTDTLNFYFESSIFKPTEQWSQQLCNLCKENQFEIAWRCETRADVNFSPATFTYLAGSGLKILDIGLESASPTQLIKMGKTTKPEQYLKKFIYLLEQCKKHDIWTKINIMLYPGENIQTLDETIRFLDKYNEYIKGVSIYPMVVYGTDIYAKHFLEKIKRDGASSVRGNLEKTGITQIHLSEDLTNEQAHSIALDISKKYMSLRDYYDLKSFNYFPRGFTIEEFETNIAGLSPKILPFSQIH